jgi:hypothetical protein
MAPTLNSKGIVVDTSGPGQHVPVVERKIQIIKQRVRCYENLPGNFSSGYLRCREPRTVKIVLFLVYGSTQHFTTVIALKDS